MTKKRTNFLIVAVLLLAVLSMYGSLYGPAIPAMYEAFPGQESGLNYFISGCTTFSLVLTLMCPFLAKKMGSRNLLIMGALICAVGGVLGLFSFNLTLMCVAQTLCSAGYGITGTMGISVLMQVVTDEKQRGTINGINQVVVAAGGAVLAIVGGAMAVKSWQTPITAGWITLVVLGLGSALMISRNLPKTVVLAGEEEGDEATDEPTPWGKVLTLAFGFLMMCCFYLFMMLFQGFYVEENALGDAMFTGTLQSLGTVGSAIACALFGVMYGKMGRKTILATMSVLTVSMFLMFLFPNRTMAIVTSTLAGAGFGSSLTYFYAICPEVLPKHITTGMSALVVAVNIPYMIGSYLVIPLMGVMGSLTAAIAVFSAGLLIELVVIAVMVCRKQK